MPEEVVLMMDLKGVLTSSPFPAARRLAENMMRCVFERASSHIIVKRIQERPVPFLAKKYSNFFFTVAKFTERTRGLKGAFERLELGELNRLEFITAFREEIDFMLLALSKQNPEELEAMNIAFPKKVDALKKRFPLLCDPVVQVHIRELLDVEAFLCTIEKVSPRKNVLNLLHYLRTKSQQEIRLFAIGNAWEFEGQYRRMVTAMKYSVTDSVSFAYPVICPVEYGESAGSYQNSFQVTGLFDGYVQSYISHKRKPYPDIFMQALEEVRTSRVPTGEALRYDMKPNIFYFDDVEAHCEVARGLPGNPFTDVLLIEDGACDVYKDIVRALKMVAEKDPFWAEVVAGVEKEIAPMFRPSRTPDGRPTSWVTEELHNYSNNLLFVGPPPNDLCSPVSTLEKDRYRMDEEDQERILFYCAQHLPHLFPLKIPPRPEANMNLRTQPGLATSAGPVLFEYVEGSRFFESYRLTLRTGSYILRIQPRGPSPYGSADIRREYETMAHLYETSPGLQIPTPLLYCDSYAVCGRRFFLRRYRDGENINAISQLIQPRIRRPYSLRRVSINVELRPKLFYKQAIAVLSVLHNSPLPPFMKQAEEEMRRTKRHKHPLLAMVEESIEMYKLALSKSGTAGRFGVQLRSATVEELSRGILACFDQTQLSHQMIPMPDRLVALHGNFNLSSVLFTHRSLEGRAKYPPHLIGMVQFKFTRLGDPLVDVASASMFCFLRQPEGICDASHDIQILFPSPSDLLEMYCSARGYMLHLDRRRRDDIFKVYLASLCLQQATMLITDIVSSTISPHAKRYSDSRSIAQADQLAKRGLDVLHSRTAAKL
ncbi:Phosphotransferase enzyme family, putative [Leishmania donovani]|uniref:Phosphotransferase enzyme family, putative n=1 Tax=Leishmania donovani TaxID=5661 RepID=A0A3S5H6W5_LEIDO|nr:Phosphotransferase enzyme family, putative [Leishmania donovani]